MESFKRGREGQDLTSMSAAKNAASDLYNLGKDVSSEVSEHYKDLSGQYRKLLKNDVDLTNITQAKLAEAEEKLVNQLQNETLPNRIAETEKMLNEIRSARVVKANQEEVKSLAKQYNISEADASKILETPQTFNPEKVQNLKKGIEESSFLVKNPDSTATNKALAGLATGSSKDVGQILKSNIPGLESVSDKLSATSRIKDILNLSNEMFTEDALKNKKKVTEIFKKLEAEGITGEAAIDLINELRSNAQKSGSSKLVNLLGKDAEEKAKVYDLTQRVQREGIDVISPKSLSVSLPNFLGQSGGGAAIEKLGQFFTSDKWVPAARTATNALSGATQSSHSQKNLFLHTNEELIPMVQTLSQDPALKGYADHLQKAIQTGDTRAKDQALFVISQNPKARQALGIDLKEQNK